MVGLWLVSVAAADPRTTVAADGAVTVEDVVAASPEAVRSMIADPIALAKLSPDVLSLELLSQGRCATLRATVGSTWAPLSYTYERCPTATGFREQLVQSDAFDGWTTEWRLEPDGAGTRVTVTTRVELKGPIPDAVVQARTKSSLSALVAKVVARALGR